MTKGAAVGKFAPQTGPSGGFNLIGGKPFVKEHKDLTVAKYNNHLVGELLALRINIGASDAEITPPQFGDLTYDDGDTSNHYNGLYSLRQLATLVDNYLTYWKRYPPVNWNIFDSMMARSNRAFRSPAPLPIVSKTSLVIAGYEPVDSAAFLHTGIAPLQNPLNFPVGSIDNSPDAPDAYALWQNYPNPFNPTTTIEFDLSKSSVVSLKVYDILGREVATLINNEELEAGSHDVQFDASRYASGVYFYRILANGGEFSQIKKMVLMK
jgi:hypothetical protein